MPVMRLTKSIIEKLTMIDGKQTNYFDTKLTGFGVRVNKNSKTYFVQTRINLKKGTVAEKRNEVKNPEIRELIGRTDTLDFDRAVDKAKKILEDAAEGISPEDRKREREEADAQEAETKEADSARRMKQQEKTLKFVLKDYRKLRKNLKESSAEHYELCLNAYLPDWYDSKPMREIGGDDILRKHHEIGAKSKAQADNVMRIVRALFNFAIEAYDDVIVKNPVRKLSTLNAWYKVGRKKTFVHPHDLPAWWSAVWQLDDYRHRNYLLLLLFTGSRADEAARLTRKDLDFRRNCIVFRETKTNDRLEVPVAEFIMDLLKEQADKEFTALDDFMFPSKRSESGHIEDLRLQYEKIIEASKVQFTPHDLRRTFLTYCETLKVPPYTQKRLCNHALPQDVTEGYIQFPIEELRKTVEQVAHYILVSAGVREKAKVVAMKGKRKGAA